jgi:hypothetical protein
MKEVRNEELPDIHGGFEDNIISPIITVPYQPALPPTTIVEGTPLPTVLAHKHVET